jgi:CDP-glucose 4,6-dehydratase
LVRRERAVAGVVKPSASFWSGKKVLVFGHTGFKGAWLSLWLTRLGARVVGCALPPEAPSLFSASGLGGIMDGHYVDIRNFESVTQVMLKTEPEIVLHLAAQSLVRRSYAEPVETYATNVMGTVHVLAASSAVSSVRSVIVVTSDKCYENREWHWAYREDEAMGGHDPYSSSKGCAELVTTAWRKSYGQGERSIGIASARAGNVIGGGDWAAERLVPDCIRALAAGETIGIRNPTSTRPWQHVLEPLCGYLLLAERVFENPKEFAEGWNFGPAEDDARPVAWVADRIASAWGDEAKWSKVGSDPLHEAHFLKVDASKARARLGWRPLLRLEHGLRWTVDWYRRFFGGRGALMLTEEQIERYCELSGET